MSSAASAQSLPPRVSRAAHVAGELEREILADVYAPGERLGTKDDLRERFGVAVATVTEALRLLETRGLTEARPGPGGGIFVARSATRLSLTHTVLGSVSDATAYRDCLIVRDALEPLICRDAAQHRQAQDVAELDGIVARMRRVDHDPSAWFALNWKLHRQLAMLTPNLPLRTMYCALLDYLDMTVGRVVYYEFDGPARTAIHRELVAAIAEGAGPRLEAAIAAHAPL
jgi:DNA-binding FadR family transcriptional regulator